MSAIVAAPPDMSQLERTFTGRQVWAAIILEVMLLAIAIGVRWIAGHRQSATSSNSPDVPSGMSGKSVTEGTAGLDRHPKMLRTASRPVRRDIGGRHTRPLSTADVSGLRRVLNNNGGGFDCQY